VFESPLKAERHSNPGVPTVRFSPKKTLPGSFSGVLPTAPGTVLTALPTTDHLPNSKTTQAGGYYFLTQGGGVLGTYFSGWFMSIGGIFYLVLAGSKVRCPTMEVKSCLWSEAFLRWVVTYQTTLNRKCGRLAGWAARLIFTSDLRD
jgi:hypothetical protein